LEDNATKDRLIERRPAIGSVTLCLVTTLYLLLVTNRSFWSTAYSYFAADHLSFVLFVVGISAVSMAIVTAFSAKYITKPFLIFFVLAAAAGSWFADQYGVVVDKEMIRNAAVSTGAEAGHLITTRFALYMMLTGILPSLVILWVRIRHRPVLSKLAHNTSVIVACLAVFVVVGFGDYRAFAGVGRAHRDILDRLNPFVPITAPFALRFRPSRMRMSSPSRSVRMRIG